MRRGALVFTMVFLLALLLGVMGGAAAEASCASLATAAGEVYALQSGGLALYDPAAGGFQPLDCAISSEFVLADSPEGLYLFSSAQQLLVQLDTAAPYGEINRWQLTQFPSSGDTMVYRAAVVDGGLYLLVSDYASDSFRGIWAWDLQANRRVACPIASVADLCCGWDGGLVVYSAPLGGEGALYSWSIHDGAAALHSAPGSMGILPGGLACDPAAQRVYLWADGGVMAFDGSSMQEIASMADDEEAELITAALTSDGQYWVRYSDWTLQTLSLSQQVQAVLRIAGHFPDSALVEAYAAAHPDVLIRYTQDDPYAHSTFAQTVLNRTLEADMIVTSTSSTLYRALVEKGYVLALDSSADIAACIDGMYPAVAEQVMWEGQRFALPLSLSVETMGYHAALLDELGLEAPTTVEELMDLCAGAALPPDTALLQDSLHSLSDVLLQQIMDLVLSPGTEEALAAAQPLLEKWERLENAGSIPPSESSRALFTSAYRGFLGIDAMGQEQIKPLLLAPADGQEPVAPASMEVVLIYAGTSQAERCLDFVAFCAQNLDAATQIALMPACNDPVPLAGLEEQTAALEGQLAEMDEQLAEQPDNEALRLQREETALALQALQDQPWEISSQHIAEYREVAAHLSFMQSQWRFDTDDLQVYQLRERLRDHQIDASTFLQKYQELRWMMSQGSLKPARPLVIGATRGLSGRPLDPFGPQTW